MSAIVKRERNGKKHWYVVTEEGMQPARRCSECRRRTWARDNRGNRCPRAGCPGTLGAPRPERRQEWHGGFQTGDEAKQAAARFTTALRDGTKVSRSTLTVGAFLEDEWLPAIVSRVRATTLASYRIAVRHHLIPSIGSIKLQALTPARLNRLYADLLAAGGPDATPLAPKTVRNIHVVIRKAFDDAIRWGRVARNVAAIADPPKRSATKAPEMRTWTTDQLRGFLESVPRNIASMPPSRSPARPACAAARSSASSGRTSTSTPPA